MNSNWSYSPETLNLGQIRRFLELCDLQIWRMTLKNNRAPLLCYFKLYATFLSHQRIQAGVTVRKRSIWVQIDDILSRVSLQFDVWPWTTIGHLGYFKLYAKFRSHWWIQTVFTVRKWPIWVKFDDFLSRVTLKFDGWPWKTIGHLFNSTSSFVHHFVAIVVFKLELESGNGQFGSNSTIFRAVWPWNSTDDLEKQ